GSAGDRGLRGARRQFPDDVVGRRLGAGIRQARGDHESGVDLGDAARVQERRSPAGLRPPARRTAGRRIMDHVAFDREPPATLTTMVMAFGGWVDAGRAATGALRHLVTALGPERLASIDSEEFFVLTQERPEVRLRADGEREIQWPRSEFFAWRGLRQDGGDGLLLFCGPEPHQRWRTYTKAFLDVAKRCGVKRIVSLGALLAGAPDPRPVLGTARCPAPAARPLLQAWGLDRRATYESRTG